MNDQYPVKVRRKRSAVRFRVGIVTIVLPLLLVLLGCDSEEPRADVAIQVFVDQNADGMWDEGDVGIPEVSVTMDGAYSASSDEAGFILMPDVSQTPHVFSIIAEEVFRLRDCGFVLDAWEQTIDVAQQKTVNFELAPAGFVNVYLESNADSVTNLDPGTTLELEEDCGCYKEG